MNGGEGRSSARPDRRGAEKGGVGKGGAERRARPDGGSPPAPVWVLLAAEGLGSGSPPAPGRVLLAAEVPGLFAAAVRGSSLDRVREARAGAAFRDARDEGALTARPRGRDHWRPRRR